MCPISGDFPWFLFIIKLLIRFLPRLNFKNAQKLSKKRYSVNISIALAQIPKYAAAHTKTNRPNDSLWALLTRALKVMFGWIFARGCFKISSIRFLYLNHSHRCEVMYFIQVHLNSMLKSFFPSSYLMRLMTPYKIIVYHDLQIRIN